MRVMISGGFDPIHVGHVRYIKAAQKLGNLIVVINSDEWLVRKKGKAFMTERDRAEIIKAIAPTAKVAILRSKSDDVSAAIRKYKPDIFAKGGDRNTKNLPQRELDACKYVGCAIYTNIGGKKLRSSSELLARYGS